MIRATLLRLRSNPRSLYGKALLEPGFVAGLLALSVGSALLFPNDAHASIAASLAAGILLAALLPLSGHVEALAPGGRWLPMPDAAFMRRNAQLSLTVSVPVMLLIATQDATLVGDAFSSLSVAAIGALLAARLPIWRALPAA